MSLNPPPRPALASGDPGAAPPTAIRVPVVQRRTVEAPQVPASMSRKRKKKDQVTELVVTLPKGMRKRLKQRAAEHGYTPEQAALVLLQNWLDG